MLHFLKANYTFPWWHAPGKGNASSSVAEMFICRKQEDLVIQEDCRLYSREQDNAHEEPMLIAQLAAQNLSLMLSQNTLNKESLARILLWLTTALQVSTVLLVLSLSHQRIWRLEACEYWRRAECCKHRFSLSHSVYLQYASDIGYSFHRCMMLRFFVNHLCFCSIEPATEAAIFTILLLGFLMIVALQVLLEWCDRQNPANKLQCIGGSTNQPSIFHNLVCMILGISACARSPHFGSESSTVLRGLGAVGNVLDEDCHPLVSKLLEIATRLWTDSNQLYSQESDFNTQLFLVPPNPLEAVM